MKCFSFVLSVFLFITLAVPSGAAPLSGASQQLYERAVQEAALPADAEVVPTRDGRSFFVVWEPAAVKGRPHKWMVSLHGSNGFATRELEVWSRVLQGRSIGIICLQWWMGTGDRTGDYYAPGEAYREIDQLLRRMGVASESSLLHGFSRGAANIYAVAAFDRDRGGHYFRAVVANSGGAALDYPPTQAVDAGRFGAQPFRGTQWVTSCGARDPNPERDGCPAMRRTADWIRKEGGELAFAIEDSDKGHGALNMNSQNAERLLDWFLR